MNKILFVCPATPLVFNYSGAASRYTQNFLMLNKLGFELNVVRFHVEKYEQAVLGLEYSSETAQTVHQKAASWREIVVPANLLQGKMDLLHRIIFDPIAYEFPFYKYLASQLAPVISEIHPELIWAEHSDVAAAVWRIAPSIPWVYSSTDLRYLIREIRNKPMSLAQFFLNQVSRRAEIKVSRSASLTVTGSITEADRLKEIGCKKVYTVPMANGDFPALDPKAFPATDVKIIHLGSLETTANRTGLGAYLSQAHSKTLELCARANLNLQFEIIGDASRIKSPLRELLKQERVTITGYVADLASILRPYDLAILPYGRDSGYRTKLPLLMGYAQVILATRSAVAGSFLPGLEDVCVLVDRVEDFPEKIVWLAAHPDERQRLGSAGYAFAERYFSLEAVQSSYTNLFDEVLAAR